MPPALHTRERVQICARFEDLGPDAPTLCGEWTTFDLAAHLVVRERNPVAGPGIVLGDRIGALGRLTESAMEREKRRGFSQVVERVRTGPPLGPFRLPGVGERVNLVEYLVHHEDVRRANGMEPRTDVDDLQERLWGFLSGGFGALLLRPVERGVGVEVARPGGQAKRIRKGDRVARLTGEPVELVLWLYGRKEHSAATLDGDPGAARALSEAHLGI